MTFLIGFAIFMSGYCVGMIVAMLLEWFHDRPR